MGVVVSNIRALELLRKRLQQAQNGQLTAKVGKRLRAAFKKEIADEFRESRDPYGRPWAPVVRMRPRDIRARRRRARRGLPPRADKPLIDTGRMRASVGGEVDGAEVRMFIPVYYASYHQHGTRFIAQRMMLPDPGLGLGPIWSGIASRESLAVLREHFGGGGE